MLSDSRKGDARTNENGPLQVAVLLCSRLLGRFLVRELSFYVRKSRKLLLTCANKWKRIMVKCPDLFWSLLMFCDVSCYFIKVKSNCALVLITQKGIK